jgi:YD repeat-containing protein
VAVKAGVQASEAGGVYRPIAWTELNNLGEAISVESYQGDGVAVVDADNDGVPDQPDLSLFVSKTTAQYDNLGRVYQSQVWDYWAAQGYSFGEKLTSEMWFGLRGEVIKTTAPGGGAQKMQYDGAGRLTTSYALSDDFSSDWYTAQNVWYNTVFQQVEYVYDANSNVTQTTSRARFHDQMTAWGALGTPSTPVPARVSYAGAYYDALDRVVASVAVGTNGGSAWTRPSSIPNSSATELVSAIAYNDAGLPWQTTDARGVQSRVTYDALGRTTQSIAAYVDGVPSNNDDATTQYTYANGHTTSVKVLLPGGGVQETGYVYGVSQTTGSGIDSNDIAQAVRYPNPNTGIASANEQDVTTINALGEARTFTDRNGTTHTYSRDILGRTIADAITTLGQDVDRAVMRLETTYQPQGQRAYSTTRVVAQLCRSRTHPLIGFSVMPLGRS